MEGKFSKRLQKPEVWAGILYYAQGLPFSLVRQVSVVFFKDRGVSLSSLGLTSFYGLPWTIKFLWSPFVDRFSAKRMWIFAMELALAFLFAVISAFALSTNDIFVVAALFMMVAIVAATHDIAIDGFYLEALSKDEQAKYSGWIVAAYRGAMLSGVGLLVALSGKISWSGVFGIVTVFFVCAAIWNFMILPKPNTNPSPKVQNTNHLEGFKKFFELSGIWLAIVFIVLFKLGDALLFGMSTPFLLDSGLTKQQLGLFSGVFGTLSYIVASIFGGWFISKFHLRKGLLYFGLIQNLAIPLYALIAWTKPGLWAYVTGIIVEQLSAGLGTAAYTNFVMRQNHPQYKATHYALATGLMSLTTMLGGALSGFGAQKFGYPVFFLMAFGASLPGLFLIPAVRRRPECQ